ncbi:hypothetical protein [Paenibacillus sp. URB8-2]|uniref:hypothetical protein n=1 Tax=Paenibacillus sp. URB8-2 TaxID=2741301 RepID=UPI0015BA45F3|nr:hypothetical protein [Paenibacillus sp. URB8-2]BCG57456.1 hypothetical protein PUR_08810 [Paenibacillus sp. URB8-2]
MDMDNELTVKDHLALAKWHLDKAIEAELAARRVQHLGKLGAARYEIAEVHAIRVKEEAGRESQLQFSDVG